MKSKIKNPYDKKFTAKILQGDKYFLKGKEGKISLKELQEFCK